MIKSITAINYLNESLKIVMGRPELSGFHIQEITGLGPPKANINATENSTDDGSVYNSARLDARNIVMKLVLFPNPTIEHTRQSSYKYFPIKKPVTLVIETDNRICETVGYVETNTPDIFSKQESIQISIICHDPYFYSYGEDGTNAVVFHGIEPNFEFPFSNESLSENLIEFGVLTRDAYKTVYYTGDAEIGMTITIHAVGEASNITIFNTVTRESMRIDTDKLATLTGSGIIAGDQIIICTVKRNKSIKLLRDGTYVNILNCLDRDTDWFQLSKGDNLFAYTVESGLENLQFRFENRIIYEGM